VLSTKRNHAIFVENHNTAVLLAHISCLVRIEMADGINLKSFAIQFNGHSPASRLNLKSEPAFLSATTISWEALCFLRPLTEIQNQNLLQRGRDRPDLCPGNLLRAARKISPRAATGSVSGEKNRPHQAWTCVIIVCPVTSHVILRLVEVRRLVGSWEAAAARS
jgi:hypothetical protein